MSIRVNSFSNVHGNIFPLDNMTVVEILGTKLVNGKQTIVVMVRLRVSNEPRGEIYLVPTIRHKRRDPSIEELLKAPQQTMYFNLADQTEKDPAKIECGLIINHHKGEFIFKGIGFQKGSNSNTIYPWWFVGENKSINILIDELSTLKKAPISELLPK